MRFLALAVLAAISTAFFAVPSQGQKEPSATGGVDSVLNDFWKVWDEGSPNAALLTFAEPSTRDRCQTVADRITGWVSGAGKYYGRDEISRVVVGSRLVRVRYFLRFDRGPLFVDLIYYRPDGNWKPLNFTTESDAEKITSEIAVTTPVRSDLGQKVANGGE